MMEIKETRDIIDILSLVPIENQLREKDKDSSKTRDMLSFVYYKLQTDENFHVQIVCREQEAVGYLIYDTCTIPGNKRLNIHRIWYADDSVLEKLQELQQQIVKNSKLKIISIMVPWAMQTKAREWGFKRKSILMEKEARRAK